ncbi:hypothetical protein [Oleiagrimonas soli]|nr:hypothetical protein [Oleiagrimonas soli]MBB6185343.1 outer membrane lipoprotein-sorting protein [Oleiagrimonas soli]
MTELPPDTARLDDAQQRLEARIARRRPRTCLTRGIAWVGAACTAMLAVALMLGPSLTGHRDAEAFAAVQHQLRDFRTLQVTVVQRANGQDLPTIHTWADRAGDVRTDIGDATSVIVNVQQRILLTLLHGPRKAMRVPLPDDVEHTGEKSLGWLKQVRDFQGKARPLPGTRTIDGYITHGWALDTGGMHIELWADAEQMPRAVDIAGSTNLHQRLKLVVNQPIDPSRFSVALPAGYTLVQPDE